MIKMVTERLRKSKGVWLGGHKVYLGTWLNIHISNDESVIGTLRAVVQIQSTKTVVLRVNRYAPNGDCAITELPTLKRIESDFVFDVRQQPGLQVDIVCVSSFKNVYHWNINVPPVTITL